MTSTAATDTVPAARTTRTDSGAENTVAKRDVLVRVRTRKTMETRAISSPRQTAMAAAQLLIGRWRARAKRWSRRCASG
jgi:hypothetical protein